MVWVRRLIPLVIIAVAYFGYTWWVDWSARNRAADIDRAALVAAQVWVATAKYAGQEERFLAYRDSLLSSEGVTREQMYEFLDRYKNRQEALVEFTLLVKQYVDSLAKEAKAARREQFDKADSAQADSVTQPQDSPPV